MIGRRPAWLLVLGLGIGLSACPSDAPTPAPPGPTPASAADLGGRSGSPGAGQQRPAGNGSPSGGSGQQAPTEMAGVDPDHIPTVVMPRVTLLLGSIEFDDEAPRQVTVGPFRIDVHEVSNAQYERFVAFMLDTGDHHLCHPSEPRLKDHRPNYWGTERYSALSSGPDHPVVWIDWYDAYAYAAWAGKRLPLEAEWEAAAGYEPVLGQKYRYPWGDRAPFLMNPAPALFDSEPWGGRLPERPESVLAYGIGQSPIGCYNMAGNVYEWCADDDLGYPGSGEVSGRPDVDRVIKGGAFDGTPNDLRVANRQFCPPLLRSPHIGFRCVGEP